MESPNPPPSESSHEALSEPPAYALPSPTEELDTEVPTLVDDLRASRRQLQDFLQRCLAPLRARLTLPIRPGSWLGLTILALNLGLFLLAFRGAWIVVALGLMAALGGPIGLAWAALILCGWAVAPVCAGAVILNLWQRGKWHLKLQVAAVVATVVVLIMQSMLREAIGY